MIELTTDEILELSDGEISESNCEINSEHSKCETTRSRDSSVERIDRNKEGELNPCTRYLRAELEGIFRSDRIGYKHHSGVILDRGDTRIETLVNIFTRRGKNCYYKFIIRHDQPGFKHYHTIHDCPWSDGTCRCFGNIFSRICTSRNISKCSIGDLKESSWLAIFNYHLQDGREPIYGKIGDSRGPELLYRIKTFRFVENEEQNRSLDEQTGIVETCGRSPQLLWTSRGPAMQTDNEEFCTDSTQQNYQKQGTFRSKLPSVRAQDQETKEIYELLMNIAHSPITDGIRCEKYLQTRYRFLNDSERCVYKAKNTVANVVSKWTIKDLMKFYKDKIDNNLFCHFGAFSEEQFKQMYFDIEDSIYKTYQLLIFQICPQYLDNDYEIVEDNDNWKPIIYNWLKCFIKFLDKQNGKQNTWYFQGASCAGKSFFLEMIKSFMLLTGNMSQWNKTCQFPLQMCVDKLVIFWNEPQCDSSALEDFKKLAGGDPISANIKCQMHQIVHKTPLIISANYNFLPRLPEWDSRVLFQYWSAAPFLKDNVYKQLHPLAFYYIIEKTCNYFEEIVYK